MAPAAPSAPSAPDLPVHRQPALLLAVAAGGAAGGPARHALQDAVPVAPSGLPVGTLVLNLAGCLLLGTLLAALAQRAPTPRARLLRAGVGSGLLGTFTTYSAVAVETDLLLAQGEAAVAAGYAGASLVGGVATAAAGAVLGRRIVGAPEPGTMRSGRSRRRDRPDGGRP